ncbi:ATP-binding protein [Rhodovibrionaceae bacterium A322]
MSQSDHLAEPPVLPNQDPEHQTVAKLFSWARAVRLESKLAVVLFIAALGSGILTFVALTAREGWFSDPDSVLILLIVDLVLLTGFATLILRRMVVLWIERRRASAGAKLHTRLAGLFALVALTPTLFIAVFSTLFFYFGLESWFSDRVSTAVKESLTVAEAYLAEHRQNIAADALAMAQDINRYGPALQGNTQQFNQLVGGQAALRSLSEAVILSRDGRILAKGGYSLLLDFDLQIPPLAWDVADRGEVALVTAGTEDRVRALLKLQGWNSVYLYVGRLVDPRVLGHMERSSDAVSLYEQLEGQRGELIITFALFFVLISLLLLLAAAWVGLSFASRLSGPIGRLVVVANRVGQGDFKARIESSDDTDEISTLSRAFNHMADDLQQQQGALLQANNELEERRLFIEAVLSGVSSGVLGLNEKGEVTLQNRAASELLSIAPERLQGRKVARLSHDVRDLLDQASRRPGRVHESQASLDRDDGNHRTFLLRVVAEAEEGGVIGGYVVTFDDITELLSVQRKAAWADVARRIAHEIKNPLTPIQLSAERLKRKYLKQIDVDQDIFVTCTDTIVRQVGDIGRMVDEFSSFARMPTAVLKEQDLRQVVLDSVSLQKSANHKGTSYESQLPEQPVLLSCDGGQLRQALTNLLKNALESIEARQATDRQGGQEPAEGRITVSLTEDAEAIGILIEDNGKGLPRQERNRLTEPYVTTREKGTGLGLAIVKKILEDHGGTLVLEDLPQGACVKLLFPLQSGTAKSPDPDNTTNPDNSSQAVEQDDQETGQEMNAPVASTSPKSLKENHDES